VICGFDEAGRGALAGPVCAAAVILSPDFPIEVLGDSKKLSPLQREKAAGLIYQQAPAWGIGWASAAEIDALNILRASLLAMERAYDALLCFDAQGLAQRPDLEGIADGSHTPRVSCNCRALVKADASVPEVMAASILAKTARDRMMVRYSWLYPEYGYAKHKGYPTLEHRERLERRGPSPIQRTTFTVKGSRAGEAPRDPGTGRKNALSNGENEAKR
jgi:ribonuclease HII